MMRYKDNNTFGNIFIIQPSAESPAFHVCKQGLNAENIKFSKAVNDYLQYVQKKRHLVINSCLQPYRSYFHIFI